MPIRLLPETLANRIAAGEVVERPASVVKELAENALDAGASRIDITLEDGGRTLIRVVDDGCGMEPDELELAVERHATSKLPGDDLLDIRWLGFRGEALPSIASVSHLTILSRTAGAASAHRLTVENGRKAAIEPAAGAVGTRIDVAGLFAALPARLKFLKSVRSENEAASEIVRRLAAARPTIDFRLSLDGRTLRFPAQEDSAEGRLRRLGDVLGADFSGNALPLSAEREGFRLSGFIGVPTYNRATAAHQLLFVNSRPVKDRLLMGALRAGYMDYLPRERHAVVALFFDIDPSDVDVNVHPAKAEVRFRDAALARALVVSAIRNTLSSAGPRVTSEGADFVTRAFAAPPSSSPPASSPQPAAPRWSPPRGGYTRATAHGTLALQTPGFGEDEQAGFAIEPSADARADAAVSPELLHKPLGAAKAQVHDTYILAQTLDGVVLVDMHAAHERLVLERIKRARADGPVPSQALLVPEVVELGPAETERVLASSEALAQLGLVVEGFGPGALLVRETPAALGTCDAQALLRDVADGLAEWGAALPLSERLDRLAGTFACHHSIRAGRRLKPEEMNALLRQIEAEPAAAQCNHGRPTYVTLSRTDLERLFHRR